jgi:hypothetical protein
MNEDGQHLLQAGSTTGLCLKSAGGSVEMHLAANGYLPPKFANAMTHQAWHKENRLNVSSALPSPSLHSDVPSLTS